MEFELKGEFIPLCDLLKITGVANSGGQGKAMVADGHVRVDGEVELRKTAKIRKGQLVDCFGETITVI
jgi:ribosome-associated protein